MLLSIIIPVYNEKVFIEKLLNELIDVNFLIDYEIIIVDDGSTDKTLQLIKQFKKKSNKKISEKILVFHKKNGGKGSAIRFGIKKASGEIIVFQDADLEYEPKELNLMLKKLLNSDKKTVIYGSRFLKKQTNWTLPSHYIGNRILSLLMTLLYWRRVGDIETGYKMFYSDSLKNINLVSDGFDIEPEITAKFIKTGLKIKEVPVTYNPRSYKEGKKITYKDGFKAIFVIFKYRFLK